MQRILMTLCAGTLFLFVQPKAQAQEQPSSFKRNLIGGSFSFGYSKTENVNPLPDMVDRTNAAFSFSPVYAHYFKEHVAIGASLGYFYSEDNNYNGINEADYNIYSFRPFIRFEIPLWQSRFAIYNDIGIYTGYIKNTYKVDGNKTIADSWSAGAFYAPGLMFRIKSNIALQASLGDLLSYNYQKSDYTTSHSFGVRGNHNGTNDFMIGINFLL